MYCTQWCPDCKLAEGWLLDHGVEYTKVDVDKNPDAAAQVRQWTGGPLITPVFSIGGAVVIDFDQHRLQEVLTERGKIEA